MPVADAQKGQRAEEYQKQHYLFPYGKVKGKQRQDIGEQKLCGDGLLFVPRKNLERHRVGHSSAFQVAIDDQAGDECSQQDTHNTDPLGTHAFRTGIDAHSVQKQHRKP